MKKSFKVNMTCHSCEMLLSDVLGELPGVKSVKADHKSGQIDVDFSAPANEAAIRKAIGEEGYTAA